MRNNSVLNEIRAYKNHVKAAFDVEKAREILTATLPPALGLGAVGVLLGVLFDKKHGIFSGLSAALGALGAAIGVGVGLYSMGKEVKLDVEKDTSGGGGAGRLEGMVSGLERFVTRVIPEPDSRTSGAIGSLADLVSWFDPATTAGLSGLAGAGSAATKPMWARWVNPEIPDFDKIRKELRREIGDIPIKPRHSDLTRAIEVINNEIRQIRLGQRGPLNRQTQARLRTLENQLRSLNNIGRSAGVLPRFSIGRLRLTGKDVLRRGARWAGWGFLGSLLGHLFASPREK